jgi:3-phosphoshikimate 1-carboxyvinyltransferase
VDEANQPDLRGLQPPEPGQPPLHIERATPGSKSIAQRVLLAAAASRFETSIGNLPRGGDVDAARRVARALRGSRGPVYLEPGESGTLARLTAGLAGLGPVGRTVTIGASGTLVTRPSEPLFRALHEAGTRVDFRGRPMCFPVRLRPGPAPRRVELRSPVSSQEVSGLLLGLAALGGERELLVHGEVPSKPYVAITLDVLSRFRVVGADDRNSIGWSDSRMGASSSRGGGYGLTGERFLLRGPLSSPTGTLDVEPDASSAAVLLAAACISGGRASIPGLRYTSVQGDVLVAHHLQAFGCATSAPDVVASLADRLAGQPGEVSGMLDAEGPVAHGATVDLSGEPDLAPPLAAVAACAALRHGAESELTGLGALPLKESDRLAVLAEGLAAAGYEVERGPDRLRIGPGVREVDECLLDPRGDHRMAFAFALLGLLRPGVRVSDPGCVGKSWPGFWEDMADAGFDVV